MLVVCCMAVTSSVHSGTARSSGVGCMCQSDGCATPVHHADCETAEVAL